MLKNLLLALGLIFSVLFTFSQIKTDQQIVDSILHTSQADTSKIKALIGIGFEKCLSADSTTFIYTKAVFHQIGNHTGKEYVNFKSQTFNTEGVYYQFTGKLDKAEERYKQSLNLGLTHKNQLIFCKALGNLGGVENNRGNYEKAADYLLKAIKIASKIKDFSLESNYMGDLGNTYLRLNQNKKAISILEKALVIAKSEDNKRFQANLYNSISVAYGNLKAGNQELDYQFKALEIYKELENSKGLATVYTNIGEIYQHRKEYPKALFYLKKCIEYASLNNDDQNLAYAYKNLADIYNQTGQIDLAFLNVNKAYEFSSLADDKELIHYVVVLKAEILNKKGDSKNAYLALKQAQQLNDTLFNHQMTDKVAEMEVKYETEKKEQEKQQLQLEKEQSETKRRTTIYAFLGAIVFLIFIVFLLQRNKNIKARFKENEILNKALFEGEQKERIRIARDLHDSIGQMLAVLKMKLSNFSHQPEAKETVEILDKTIAEVRHISHNLIPEALNFGLMNAIEDLADKMNASGEIVVTASIEEEARNHQFNEQNALSVYRVVQEVLGNMAKHSQAKEISLLITKANHQFNISIKDNGQGFDTSKIKESKGLGWKNINARLRLIDGKIEVVSEKLIGTQIEIVIPG